MAKKTKLVRPSPPWPRAACLAAALGFGYFLAVGGTHAIVPGHIDWLMRADWSQHYLGWAFFRHTPWQWPLGTITSLGYPVGTTVALTDANPLFALALRPFASWLPEPFQYIGFYMALSMALQGFLGAWISHLLGARPKASALGGCLFVLTPALLHRMDHDTLMGHWLILASIGLTLWQPENNERRRWLTSIWATAILAALIHPYLLAMALPILCVAVLQHLGPQGLVPAPVALMFAVGVAASLALIAWALGYLSGQANWGTDGFGYFSADMAAWFNSQGWSRMLPALPVHRGQIYEGFGYLGLGLLALCAVGAATAAHQRLNFVHKRRSWALSVVAVGALLFAWGPYITFKGALQMNASAFYAPIEHYCAMFRASGRFVWVPTYLGITAALGAVMRGYAQSAVTKLLVALVLLQLVDVHPQNVHARLTQDPKVAMTDPIWRTAQNEYDHIALVPPNFPTSHVSCNPRGYPEKIEMPPGLLAAAMGMTINSAYLSRSDPKAISAYCAEFNNALNRGITDGRTVYLVHPDFLTLMHDHGAPMVCFRADAYMGCVRKDRKSALVRAILAQKGLAAP